MGHIHSVYDTDNHFKVNGITRVITNESTSKVSVIQYDHNSERFTFEIPRHIETHDMMECNVVQVYFRDAEGNADVYTVDDLQVSPEDEDVVVCSWLLSQSATKSVGTLRFLLRFACISDDKVDYAWHTAVYSGIAVAEGMFNEEELLEERPDFFVQIMSRIDAFESYPAQIADLTERVEAVESTVTGFGGAISGMETALAGKISYQEAEEALANFVTKAEVGTYIDQYIEEALGGDY